MMHRASSTLRLLPQTARGRCLSVSSRAVTFARYCATTSAAGTGGTVTFSQHTAAVPSLSAALPQQRAQPQTTSQSSETLSTENIEELEKKIPAGWQRVGVDAPVSVTTPRKPDADGIVSRPEAEHRRIYQPYASTSPFASVPATDADASAYISKKFCFGQFGPLYHWMGRVGAMAEVIGVFPNLDWFFLEVAATVPLSDKGLHLAWYMNDEEGLRGEARNTSDAVAFDPDKSMALPGNNPCALDPETRRQVEQRALGQFCWVIAGDAAQRETFTSEVYLQWYHRADYLVNRKAKEHTEYRNNLTLEQLLQSASQNRKRRRERAEDVQAMRDKFKPLPTDELPPQFLKFKSKKERETARQMQLFGMDGRDGTSPLRSASEVTVEDVREMAPSRHQFAIDTLPREVRERLESDDAISGFGGGVRQHDPVSVARAQAPNGYSSMNSGGGWHP